MQKKHHEQCRDYYQSSFQNYLQNSDNTGKALDACLQRFLNQSPSGKRFTPSIRAQGLVNTGLLADSKAVAGSALASLALNKILRYDDIDILPTELIDQLACHNPETLRWAIRYSGLFEHADSPIWQYLRTHHHSQEWQTFFSVCERLLEQLHPFELLIEQAELVLKRLSLLELLVYLSVMAYSDLHKSSSNNIQRRWDVYDRIILRKLKTCSPREFELDEKTLGKSLQRHLSPLLFPSNSGRRDRCISNLEALALLIEATSERMDYKDSIDWFRFDPLCSYQMVPGEPVIFNISDAGTRTWEETGHKYDLLWHYWLNRAVEVFAESDLAEQIIGAPENHEANQLAYIKAMCSTLQLRSIYGLADQVVLDDGTSVPLLQLLLTSELNSIFFDQKFIQPFLALTQAITGTIEALGTLALEGLKQGENRFPLTWSKASEKAARIKGWTVCDEHPNGSIDIAHAILRFWTNDLKTLASTTHEFLEMKTPRLTERPYYKIGNYSFQFPWVMGQQNNLTSAVNNLRRLGSRRPELQEETQRVEQQLGKLLEERGFKVIIGYQPSFDGKDNAGEMDLICYLDGTLLLLEVKSGYIRRSPREVWLHQTNTLRKAAWQLRRKREALIAEIEQDEKLKLQLSCNSERSYNSLHCWIVDTSIELDGQTIDGFPVVSREVLEVVLRDEKHLLRPLNEMEENQPDSLFPNGFSASHLMHLVEDGHLWQGL